jgi:hypothetical protein
MTELHQFRKNKKRIGESVILSPRQTQIGMSVMENPEGSRRTRRSPASEPRTYSVSGCLRRLTTLISIFEMDYLEFPDGTPELLAKEFQSSVQVAVGELRRIREILLKTSRLCAQRKKMSRHKIKQEFRRDIQNLVRDMMKDEICESISVVPSLDALQLNTMGTLSKSTPCSNINSYTSVGTGKNAKKPDTSAVMCMEEPSWDITLEEILNADMPGTSTVVDTA